MEGGVIGARYSYAATGFPMDYWDYYRRDLPFVRRLYRYAARAR